MQVLCDVHISYKIVRFFEQNGIIAVHINTILQKWNTLDRDISAYADQHDFVLVTKDADFQASHFLKQTPKKLLKIALGNLSTRQTIAILSAHLSLLRSSFSKKVCYAEIGQNYIHIID
jgi:predicted nuclease of predicted toxin-antitoxin system